jgi:hypothetical protein
MLSARRVTLDAILLEGAAAAGAEVRTQTLLRVFNHDLAPSKLFTHPSPWPPPPRRS